MMNPAYNVSTPCLSDDEVLAFAVGCLPAEQLQEAHVHLDDCELCQRLLSEAAHALATAATAPPHDAPDLSWHTTFRPGTLVGQRYLIRRFIARGGMGEVYEAFDRELQERVALKTVTSTACDDPTAVRRLKAEVQLARRVSHPNVCRIYDFGTHVMPLTGAQISFLTMEFVDGETLGQRVRLAGPLPIDEACALGRQLLRGLSAAHEAGVLHRDFKSDNVMLRAEPGEESTPLIMDFGLARALDRDPRQGISTSNPTLVGTFDYIAPEQLEGKPHSTASDVYAFGIVWFEMLTGELPFESDSSPAVAALERLQKSAPAPSTKNPLVPNGLDELVLGCLRRSPKERHRTPAEVLAALDALESRQRSRFQKRTLFLLALTAGLGVFAAVLAFTAPPKRPTAALVRTLSSATPAPRAELVAELANSGPKPGAVRTPAPAAHDSRPTRRVAGSPPVAKRAPVPADSRGSPPSSKDPPLRADPPESPLSPTPPQPSVAKKGWEDPFGSSTEGELVVDVHPR